MKRHSLRLVLVLITVVGLAGSIRSSNERMRLQAEWLRLRKQVGDLNVTDPQKIAFRAVDSGEPFHFVWRVRTPANYHGEGADSHWSGQWFRASPSEFLARMRFRLDPESGWNGYRSFAGNTSTGRILSKRMVEFLQGRWDQLKIEQIGDSDTVEVAPGDSVILLRISLPPKLEAEARRTLPRQELGQIPVIYEYRLGPAPAPVLPPVTVRPQ